MLYTQDTQSDMRNSSMEGEFVTKNKQTKSSFYPDNSKQKSGEQIQKEEGQKQSATIVLADQTNIVKIKPKNRTMSNANGGQNNENSVQPIHESQSGQKCDMKRSKKVIKEKTKLGQELSVCKAVLKPRDFMLRPVETATNFTIKRYSGLLKNEFTIHLQGNQSKIITYERKCKLLGNKILIRLPKDTVFDDLSEKMDSSLLGWLQSNYDGSVFNLSEINQLTNVNHLVATFQYRASVDKVGGPRKVKAFIKDREAINPLDHLEQDTNTRQLSQKSDSNAVQTLQMKQTKFDPKFETYGLSFHTKKEVKSSVHNMILVNNENKPMLKLFKVEHHDFQLQVLPPMTPLIGCAFAMSSLIFKLASQ